MAAGLGAALGLVLVGQAGRVAAAVSLAVAVGAPLVRVGWLGVRWLRKGDRRFALAAFAVLAVVAVGVALA